MKTIAAAILALASAIPTVIAVFLATTSFFAQAGSPSATYTNIATAIKYAQELRDRMRDPDSFVVDRVFTQVLEPLTKQQAKRLGKKEAARYTNYVGTTEFCFEYRSRNGYGGMNRGLAITSWEGNLVPFDQNILDLIGGPCAAVRPGTITEITINGRP